MYDVDIPGEMTVTESAAITPGRDPLIIKTRKSVLSPTRSLGPPAISIFPLSLMFQLPSLSLVYS
jgi:hypothetical protein